MDIRPIKTEADYNAALARINELMDAVPDTAEGDELDILVTLVEVYEERHYPIAPPDPIEAIVARIEELGYTRKDLEPLIGSRGRVSEVLSRKRSLSIDMIRRLHKHLRIPLESLVSEEREIHAA
jgi:HTH-type transcriptional regulator/antitoxin HigA